MVDIAQLYGDNLEPLDVLMRLSMVALYMIVMTITPLMMVLENFFFSRSSSQSKDEARSDVDVARNTQAKEQARRQYSRCLDLLFWINIACFMIYFAIRMFESNRASSANTNTSDKCKEMCTLCSYFFKSCY